MLTDHPPIHPGGACATCGQPWPCFERQVDSIVDFAGHRQALAELMADYLRMGVAERRSRGLPDDPEMPARHLGWIDCVVHR
ncbi:hypothetical protein AWW66_26660 [Micromonospora rosaria]|uniref:Flavin reductase n=1 Tax=Micromonospora rosaria TaxID=47874 RepID=A0A136PKT2_9ACTN|nr:hypothetical protein [Micromonospora rosaria]KXK58988.1 hypothetical protein AWW66_26660 [Micromonospora rosaria]